MEFNLPISADQSQLDAILTQIRANLNPSEREALVLCDADEATPYRTIRSRLNGVQRYIEQNGQWGYPTHKTEAESLGAEHPDWTPQMVDDILNSDTYPFG